MKKYILRILFIGILLNSFSCKIKKERTNDHQEVLRKIALFFNEPVDSIIKHVTINDSVIIHSLDVEYYNFSDHRLEDQYWKNGVIAYNIQTGNYNIFSLKEPGYPIENSNHVIDILQPDLLKSITFRNLDNDVDFYHLKYIAQSHFLSSILNNLSIRQKEAIGRTNLDSLFMPFLCYLSHTKKIVLLNNNLLIDSALNAAKENIVNEKFIHPAGSKQIQENRRLDTYQRINGLNALFHLIESYQDSLFIFKRMPKETYEEINSKYSALIDRNFDKSLFVYKNSNMNIWVITINENFIGDRASRGYFQRFANGNTMYDVKIYCID